jgi:hypothetical protein
MEFPGEVLFLMREYGLQSERCALLGRKLFACLSSVASLTVLSDTV